MRVMEKPSSQKYVRSVLSLHTDLDFAVIPGSVLRRPESIQFSINLPEMFTDLDLMNFQEN